MFQPVLPAYRLDFFRRLAGFFGDRFEVLYSPTPMGVLTEQAVDSSWAKSVGPLRNPVPGVEWQGGALTVPIGRGDIVVVSGVRSLSNLLLVLKARLRGARTVWWGHLWSSTTKSHRFAIRMLLTNLSDAVLFYTDQEIEEYRSGYGRRDSRVVAALNNGLDVAPIQAHRMPYRAASRQRAILFIGRLTEKTGLGELFVALSDPRLTDVSLKIVGDGPHAGELSKLADSLGITAQIEWRGGTVDEGKIAAAMNKCRLFAYPGAVGLSLVHAMAYGLPAVVHSDRWRHMPEIAAFTEGATGLSYVPGDAGALADTIVSALDDHDRLDRWSAECIQRADNVYNTAIMAERFKQLIQQLG